MSLPDGLYRRSVLAAAASIAGASVAGCTSIVGTSKGATEVVIHNERAEAISLALTITGANEDEPRYDETITLDSLERARPNKSDQLPEGTDYTIEVVVEDALSETFEWRDVRVELAPLHVIVSDSSNILFALQAG